MNKITPSESSLLILDRCASTSVEAKRLYGEGAKTPLKTPLWVLARKQEAGYGRRGRAWQMQEGDFAGSLLFAPDAPLTAFGEISFITGLAVFGALESLFAKASPARASPARNKISLKWPNDVLIDGAKVCGILLELINPAPPYAKRPALCIGIGINVVATPQALPYPATALCHHGLTPDIETLAGAIDTQFHLWTEIWYRDGFAPIRKAWCEQGAGIGEAISVRLDAQTLTGIFGGIDEAGQLILVNGARQQLISAGDVFFEGQI